MGGVDGDQVRTRPYQAIHSLFPILPTPTAAPTRKRPRASLLALGFWIFFSMSLTVIKPLRRNSSSTTRSFSMRC